MKHNFNINNKNYGKKYNNSCKPYILIMSFGIYECISNCIYLNKEYQTRRDKGS